MLEKFNITNIRKAKTPCTSYYSNIINTNEFDKTTYKNAIGSLIYLSRCTRPDIAFAVSKASRCSEHPL